MNKSKIWILAAVALILVGATVFVATMTSINWNWMRLSTETYETNVHDIFEDFDGIIINSDTADITFLPSEDGVCRVICHEKITEKHLVEVLNGNLSINLNDTGNWYDHITVIGLESPKITVCLPEKAYGLLCIRESTGDIDISSGFVFEDIDINVSTGYVECRASASGILKINGNTGDVHIEDVSAGEMEIDLSTGKITAADVICDGKIDIRVSTGDTYLTRVVGDSFMTSGGTGDIDMESVVITKKMEIVRSTGDVRFDGCDAGEIYVDTSTGDVIGTLLSPKIFKAKSNTGSEKVPALSGSNNGLCEINCDTGDIIIEIGE